MFNLSLNEKFPDTKSEPSPRKKLGDLFVEASEEPMKVVGSPVVDDSATNSPLTGNGMTPNREKKRRDRLLNYGSKCCIPGFAGAVGIDGRKQKSSPSPCTV